jgi:hypothetical protein
MFITAIPRSVLEDQDSTEGKKAHAIVIHDAVKANAIKKNANLRLYARAGSSGTIKQDINDFVNSPLTSGVTMDQIFQPFRKGQEADNDDPLAALDAFDSGGGPYFELSSGGGDSRGNAMEFADEVSKNLLIIGVQCIHPLNRMQTLSPNVEMTQRSTS